MSTGATGEFVIRFMARAAEIDGSHVIRQCPRCGGPARGGPMHSGFVCQTVPLW
jgi:hypothetical protein